jgi:hypothetical protein
MEQYVSPVLFLLFLWLAFSAWRVRRRGRGGHIGPAAGAMLEDILDDQRRAAVEIIVEERASYRDPEDRDGNLPKLSG